MKWKGNAKYNQELEQSTVFDSEYCNVTIHRIVHFDGWFLTCNKLGISQKELKSENFNDATKEAREIIKSHLDILQEKFSVFINDNSDEQVRNF